MHLHYLLWSQESTLGGSTAFRLISHLIGRRPLGSTMDPTVVHEIHHSREAVLTICLTEHRTVSLGDGLVDLTGGRKVFKRPLPGQQLKQKHGVREDVHLHRRGRE